MGEGLGRPYVYILCIGFIYMLSPLGVGWPCHSEFSTVQMRPQRESVKHCCWDGCVHAALLDGFMFTAVIQKHLLGRWFCQADGLDGAAALLRPWPTATSNRAEKRKESRPQAGSSQKGEAYQKITRGQQKLRST